MLEKILKYKFSYKLRETFKNKTFFSCKHGSMAQPGRNARTSSVVESNRLLLDYIQSVGTSSKVTDRSGVRIVDVKQQ